MLIHQDRNSLETYDDGGLLISFCGRPDTLVGKLEIRVHTGVGYS
jgi:hypothetical protein